MYMGHLVVLYGQVQGFGLGCASSFIPVPARTGLRGDPYILRIRCLRPHVAVSCVFYGLISTGTETAKRYGTYGASGPRARATDSEGEPGGEPELSQQGKRGCCCAGRKQHRGEDEPEASPSPITASQQCIQNTQHVLKTGKSEP